MVKKLPTMTEDEQFALLASDGMMVKRPLLITDSTVIPGFKEDLWNRLQLVWSIRHISAASAIRKAGSL